MAHIRNVTLINELRTTDQLIDTLNLKLIEITNQVNLRFKLKTDVAFADLGWAQTNYHLLLQKVQENKLTEIILQNPDSHVLTQCFAIIQKLQKTKSLILNFSTESEIFEVETTLKKVLVKEIDFLHFYGVEKVTLVNASSALRNILDANPSTFKNIKVSLSITGEMEIVSRA